mgnify:FL=1
MKRNVQEYECDSVKSPERFLGAKLMTDEKLSEALSDALKKIDQLWDDMQGKFPSESSVNNRYVAVENDQGWNTGFWCGMLWLAYETSGDEKYRKHAESLLPTFYKRIEEKLGCETHDLGFVYVPSCVAAYKLTGNEKAKEAALMAADHLMTRYNKDGGYIQAWGKVGEQLRLIVDCMNNIPLLYWASEVTGDDKYKNAAHIHAETTIKYIVREDGSTYHTFFFHPDGTPDKGTTCQGFSDDSCWSRGQAWILSGLPLTYKYIHDEKFVTLYTRLANYYLNHLPKDYVAYWDLTFTDGDEPRDSSSAAIACCGLLEMIPNLKDEKQKEIYAGAVDKMMYSLYENYSTKDTPESDGLLLHAVYSKPGNFGVDECNIWGCYYYMEALSRLIKGVKGYW